MYFASNSHPSAVLAKEPRSDERKCGKTTIDAATKISARSVNGAKISPSAITVPRSFTKQAARIPLPKSPNQVEAQLLHHEWGFSFEEIAGMLGITAAAARARASRGMADLRVALNSLQRARA